MSIFRIAAFPKNALSGIPNIRALKALCKGYLVYGSRLSRSEWGSDLYSSR